MTATDIVTRFAPSPTGYLHLGHALSALFGFREAQKAGGRFLVRIEDIDQGRCRPEFSSALIEDLHWLGLHFPQPLRRQSEHLAEYHEALSALTLRGLTYPCFCSRKEILDEVARAGGAPHGPEGVLYPGTCKRTPPKDRKRRMEQEPYAIRLDLERALGGSNDLWFFDRGVGKVKATPDLLGDVVLGRKGLWASYHLAVVLDDALQGVTLVTRGEDLFFATHLHRLLQALLGLPTPEYHHHPLVKNEQGVRLAKRDRAKTLRALREGGTTSEEVLAQLREWLP